MLKISRHAMSYEAHTSCAKMEYSGCWQNEGSACEMGWLLALVRLGVANVRWACAAPQLATHRKQMPIAANERMFMRVAIKEN